MEKITAIIPTYNEEVHIKAAIESVLWCDEVIVVDSFSNDKTLEIVASFPQVRLLQNKFEYFAAQKNWAIPQASHPWVLLLDADERAPASLAAEIQRYLKEGTPNVGFWIRRQNYFMDKLIQYSGWQSDKVVRFFKRDKCRYEDVRVHEEIVGDGPIGILKEKLLHYTYRDLTSYLIKADRYTSWGALDRFSKMEKSGKKIGLPYLVFRPFGRFLRDYFLKLGFLDGTHGFVVCALSSYYVFTRAVKIWRLQNGEKIKDPFKK